MPDGAGSARYHALGAVDHPLPDPCLIGWPAPRIRKVRVDRDLEIDAVALDIDHELCLLWLPLRTEARILHPQAVEHPAGSRPLRINIAALSGYGVPAPHAGRLGELLDRRHLAAHHAGAAGASRNEVRRVRGCQFVAFHAQVKLAGLP